VEIGAQIAKIGWNLVWRYAQKTCSVSAPRQIAIHQLPAKDGASSRDYGFAMLCKKSLCIARSLRGALQMSNAGKERNRSHEQKSHDGLRMGRCGPLKDRRKKQKPRQSGPDHNQDKL
jgi:hypothetical protein